MIFFSFCLFPFSKYQMTMSNHIMDFEYSQEVLICHKYFRSTIFGKETTALLNFFEIFIEMHFNSLIFPNERNITTSFLMIHLKCTFVHYSNLNFEHKAKFDIKWSLFFKPEIGVFEKECAKKVLKIQNSIVIENFTMSHKMAVLKCFCEITQKSSFNSQYN